VSLLPRLRSASRSEKYSPVEACARELHNAFVSRTATLERAAVDLALQQADTNLAERLGATYDPIRFVVSTRLEDPPTGDRMLEWLDRDPELEFKLDPTSGWTGDVVRRLAGTDTVRRSQGPWQRSTASSPFRCTGDHRGLLTATERQSAERRRERRVRLAQRYRELIEGADPASPTDVETRQSSMGVADRR